MPKHVADGLAVFGRDLDAFLSQKTWHSHIAEKHVETLAEVVIASAQAGIGPKGQRYPPYSASYRKQLGLDPSGHRSKKRTGKPGAGNKRFLMGMGSGPHMLDISRFSIEVEPDGKAWFTWTPDGEDMATRAHVHNDGLPIGKNGPVKQREFMHFENAANSKALQGVYEATMHELIAQFNAGRKPK